MQTPFGAGNLYGTSLIGATPTPRKFGALQDVSLDISFAEKTLYGQSQFAFDVARGQGKIAGKAKVANINAAMYNDLFINGALTTGQTKFVYQEAMTGGASVVAVNGATYKDDLGVFYASSGIQLTRVASAPATGQYTVNTATGTYVFAAGDGSILMYIDYSYTVAGSGSSVSVVNPLAGSTPYFSIVFPMNRTINGVTSTVYFKLFKCTTTKLTFATKIEDFTIPEFDFVAIADSGSNVFAFSNAE